MQRIIWMLTALLAVGCTGTESPTSAPATTPASASDGGSDSKPADAGSDKKPEGGSAAKTDVSVTPVAFNVTGAPVVEISTPAMHCEACAARIVQTLREQPGVVDVKADADTKMVMLAVTESGFDNQAALDALGEAGFGEEAKVVEAEAPADNG